MCIVDIGVWRAVRQEPDHRIYVLCEYSRVNTEDTERHDHIFINLRPKKDVYDKDGLLRVLLMSDIGARSYQIKGSWPDDVV